MLIIKYLVRKSIGFYYKVYTIFFEDMDRLYGADTQLKATFYDVEKVKLYKYKCEDKKYKNIKKNSF